MSIPLGTLISQTPILVNGPVNGLMFPNDVILRKSINRQKLNGQLVIGDLQINGRLDVGHTINGLNWQTMSELFNGNPTQFGLHVLGKCNHNLRI